MTRVDSCMDGFIEFLRAAPQFAKANIMCYAYHNMCGCAECPLRSGCANSDDRWTAASGPMK